MQQGAGYLIGEHDFKSFSTYKPEVENTVRTIYELGIHRSEDDVITIRIRGNGFLYNMVRIIAGTLVDVGLGKTKPEDIEKIIKNYLDEEYSNSNPSIDEILALNEEIQRKILNEFGVDFK